MVTPSLDPSPKNCLTTSARQPTITRRLVIPVSRNPSMIRCKTGLPRTSSIGLGRASVRPRMRVPRPAARRTALFTSPSLGRYAVGRKAAIVSFASRGRSFDHRAMRLLFLAKYREFGLILIRLSLGLLFILYTVPVLIAGGSAWSHFGAGARTIGIHSHHQLWGFIGALAGCVGGVLMIFGLFFRVGVLLVLVLALAHAIGMAKASGFRT